MTEPVSKYRHISFTAHYTGYVWYRMGISHPNFATQEGQMYAQVVDPAECLAEFFWGSSIRTTLKQRHEMLDARLEALIAENPQVQILEIACGLSPRGWLFREKYPDIQFVELDLPDMAQMKREALAGLQPEAQVIGADLFSERIDAVFRGFDVDKPLVIISEGLINYFALDQLRVLLQRLVKYTQGFQALHYLSDVYPMPLQPHFRFMAWQASWLLKTLSHSDFDFHFNTPSEVAAFFKSCGFGQVDLLQPSAFQSRPNVVTPIEQQHHRGDLVWVIEAQR